MPIGGRVSTLPLLSLLLLIPAVLARPASGFGPEASEWLARRLPEALPVEARDPLWITETQRVLEERGRDEEAFPEMAAILHRFDALAPRSGSTASARDSLVGLAPFALTRAVGDLRQAFRRRNPVLEAAALARIAQGVADLSDPFLVTPIDPAEIAGARAWFGDEFAASGVDDLAVSTRVSGDPFTEALALAVESAARRPAVEQTVLAQDAASVTVLRRERLARALAVGAALVRRAWRDGGSPLAQATRAGLQAKPNPARAGTSLLFAIPVAGAGRLELFDVGGRRVIDRDLGPIEAGVHRIRVDADWIRDLPAGVYLARVSVGTVAVEGRLVRLAP